MIYLRHGCGIAIVVDVGRWWLGYCIEDRPCELSTLIFLRVGLSVCGVDADGFVGRANL
jgi:hypothetical protein